MERMSFWSLFLSASAVIIGSWFWAPLGSFIFLENSSAATSSEVTVSATVGAVISCSSNVASTDFGALTSGSISTSAPNASTTMSCANSAAGCTLSVKDAGGGGNPGLWNSANSYIVPSPNAAYAATATLVAGTEGYGIQATTTASGTGTLNVPARYKQTGNAVGGLLIAGTTVASSTAAVTGKEIVVTHKAAISATTTGGTYADTITYSCLAN